MKIYLINAGRNLKKCTISSIWYEGDIEKYAKTLMDIHGFKRVNWFQYYWITFIWRLKVRLGRNKDEDA